MPPVYDRYASFVRLLCPPVRLQCPLLATVMPPAYDRNAHFLRLLCPLFFAKCDCYAPVDEEKNDLEGNLIFKMSTQYQVV